MAKRGNSEDGGTSSSGGPPAKKLMTQFESIKIGPVFTLVSIYPGRYIQTCQVPTITLLE